MYKDQGLTPPLWRKIDFFSGPAGRNRFAQSGSFYGSYISLSLTNAAYYLKIMSFDIISRFLNAGGFRRRCWSIDGHTVIY
jgi:hypothetical protein